MGPEIMPRNASDCIGWAQKVSWKDFPDVLRWAKEIMLRVASDALEWAQK